MKFCICTVQFVAVVCTAWAQVVLAQSTTDEHLEKNLGVAEFTAADKLIFPADTDRWVILGTNIGGDHSNAEFDPKNPGTIGVVQMEPNAYNYLLENKRYADGTMLLLSFYETQEKPEPELNGFVQGDLSSREIHVIDRQKYQDDRGFYLFPGDEPAPSEMLPAGNDCVQCHSKHGDFDSTFAQLHPTIRDSVVQNSD